MIGKTKDYIVFSNFTKFKIFVGVKHFANIKLMKIKTLSANWFQIKILKIIFKLKLLWEDKEPYFYDAKCD